MSASLFMISGSLLAQTAVAAPIVGGTAGNNGLYSWTSFGTLAGAAAITLLICNVLQKVFGFSPKWLALLVAEVVSFVGLIWVTKRGGQEYVLAFVNGFLIYSAAVGGNQATGQTSPPPSPPPPAPLGGAGNRGIAVQQSLNSPPVAARRFNERWF